MAHVQAIGIQETVKGLRVLKGLDLGFVEALTKFTPHGIEHHFGQGAEPRVLLDFVVLQLDAFLLDSNLECIFVFVLHVSTPAGHPLASCLIFNQVLT